MLVLITYDVNVTTIEGRRRLRSIAKICQDYGVRVQNSVFECEVEPAQFVTLKASLLSKIDTEHDSLRIYYLGSRATQKKEHYGTKVVKDPLHDVLIL